jgi:Pyruvate formate lyase-like
MPNGGFRMVANAVKTYGYQPDPHVVEAFSKDRKTHNDGVFDAHTADIRRCRSSHVLTGLPDAYGRGRIIGDYRRVALYGVARLIEHKHEEKDSLDAQPSTEDIIRDREELSEQIRALKELQKMASAYGFDISGPARTANKAEQWLYFAYLAAVKEQNGAAMSLGRTTTFLDGHFERDLAAGVLTEEQAQEIIDDFVIKLRIVRFLRTPEYDELFAGDPTWVTESIAGMGDDGRSLVTKTSFRILQTLYNLGPAPEANLTIWYSPRLPDGFRRLQPRSRSTPAPSSSRATRSCAAPGATTAPSPAACRRCSSASRCSSSAPARISPSVSSTRSMAGATRSPATRSARSTSRSRASTSSSNDVVTKFEAMMDWLPGVYVNAMNVIHYMHDKYAYERIWVGVRAVGTDGRNRAHRVETRGAWPVPVAASSSGIPDALRVAGGASGFVAMPWPVSLPWRRVSAPGACRAELVRLLQPLVTPAVWPGRESVMRRQTVLTCGLALAVAAAAVLPARAQPETYTATASVKNRWWRGRNGSSDDRCRPEDATGRSRQIPGCLQERWHSRTSQGHGRPGADRFGACRRRIADADAADHRAFHRQGPAADHRRRHAHPAARRRRRRREAHGRL